MAKYCKKCGEEMIKVRNSWICTNCDDDDDDDDIDGCEACGNPAYPDCMTSCAMFDD